MKTFILLASLIPGVVFAQTFHERAAALYLETDKNFDLDCHYSFNSKFKLITPVSETTKGANSISRDFIIENTERSVPMNFMVKRVERDIYYSIQFDGKYLSTGKLGKRDFFIAPSNDKTFNAEFETTSIYCSVNFAYAYPYELRDGNYHFSVHPHKTYDWQSRLKAPIEAYLNNPDYKSIILLETGNYRGNLVNIHHFLDGVDYKLPATSVDSALENVPTETDLIVSPAGNNRFDFKVQNEINITFSGGNHNYCIWNATRHVIESLMLSKSEARIQFNYDTKAIVAQIRGVEGLRLNFPRRDVNRSNLLSDLLKNNDNVKQYHDNYISYFSGYLARRFKGQYKTYTIHYKAEGYSRTVVLEGNGSRQLEVVMNYLY